MGCGIGEEEEDDDDDDEEELDETGGDFDFVEDVFDFAFEDIEGGFG
jgi:hypothetical protein